MQVQDLALARQKVVLDVEPIHGLQMPPQDRSRNQLGNLGQLVAALLDGMQRVRAHLQMFFVLLVPLRDARIQIPAVIIEAMVRLDQFHNVRLATCFSSWVKPTTTSATCTPVLSM